MLLFSKSRTYHLFTSDQQLESKKKTEVLVLISWTD